MRALVRYWFVVPLLFVVVSLQIGLSLVTVHGETVEGEDSAETSTTFQVYVSTSLPVMARTLTPTPTPIATPGPAAAYLPTDTPAGYLWPVAVPSLTPVPYTTPAPGPTPLAGGTNLRVPILMYHYASAPPAGADIIRQDLSVTPAQFESHLAYLRQAGYETISLNQLAYALSQQAALPPKPVILTFDDGYRDNYEVAFPLLRQYGYIGTFFPITLPIDQNHPSYLTWDMVIEMHRAGMEFGSHSYRHSDLSDRDADFLVYEIVGSKEAIEARIGEPVRFFSYPSGRYDDMTIQVLASAYFWGAVTTEWGIDQSFSDRFELVRIRIRGSDTADVLARKLNMF